MRYLCNAKIGPMLKNPIDTVRRPLQTVLSKVLNISTHIIIIVMCSTNYGTVGGVQLCAWDGLEE